MTGGTVQHSDCRLSIGLGVVYCCFFLERALKYVMYGMNMGNETIKNWTIFFSLVIGDGNDGDARWNLMGLTPHSETANVWPMYVRKLWETEEDERYRRELSRETLPWRKIKISRAVFAMLSFILLPLLRLREYIMFIVYLCVQIFACPNEIKVFWFFFSSSFFPAWYK